MPGWLRAVRSVMSGEAATEAADAGGALVGSLTDGSAIAGGPA